MALFDEFLEKVLQYEDPEKLDAALQVLPLETLFQEAETMKLDGSGSVSEEDNLVKAVLKWFKTWFSWVNAPPCDSCGCKDTQGPTPVKSNKEDLLFGATVVELWLCPLCSYQTRFPRYNDPVKLLETRKGRCGEWCNAMQLILRALGRDVRFVWNSEDHVWNEIWSTHEKRWIHIDSCEASFDNPLIYADGWGKKMAYVIGFSVGGVRDITTRYVRRPDAALPRTIIDETQLQLILTRMTSNQRQNLDPVELVEWYERDEQEMKEFALFESEQVTTTQPVLPRQSGSKDWTEARGEAGK